MTLKIQRTCINVKKIFIIDFGNCYETVNTLSMLFLIYNYFCVNILL